ncbi:DUF5316 family protein [Oceanobacillus iheyensis]|uniref:Hypothetical conserved protein n=1 Tax=Oceanobacillus iheyensis (strain DSM 14371 / CIP 107618 / JCM 11309 / KCTC 3954 / HTE831) TaxID=221109 RepID=Q8ETD1_OCEIH|nr:DUF5316 family protein [Oceanobacillus iheyensis]BAC12286.1 hypothetical conserved protein [Oceanobacillus iheyensis HTE831]
MLSTLLEALFYIFFLIGLISLIISGLVLGTWKSGPDNRADYYSQSKEQRHYRTNFGLKAGGIGILSALIAVCIYFVQ